MTTATAPISPAQLGAYIATRPSAPTLTHLHQQSAVPSNVVTDTLAHSVASHDALRQHLKILLAGTKLHAGLIVAALGALKEANGTLDTVTTSPADAIIASVEQFVERAEQWIEATTAALVREGGPSEGNPTVSDAPDVSDVHRYALARTLVTALQRQPGLVEHTEPKQMAAWLATPAQHLPIEPDPQPWVSVSGDADWSMAWSRALVRVVEVAIDHDFNRELPVLLADARTVIAEVVERQTQRFAQDLALPPDALRIVQMQSIALNSRLYAATLAQVHAVSARAIQAYQDCVNQEDHEGAHRQAQAYQDRQLGYVGVPHHFRALVALHEQEQAAALTALQAAHAAPATAVDTAAVQTPPVPSDAPPRSWGSSPTHSN